MQGQRRRVEGSPGLSVALDDQELDIVRLTDEPGPAIFNHKLVASEEV